MTTILPNLTDGPVAMAFDPQGRLFYTEKADRQIGSCASSPTARCRPPR